MKVFLFILTFNLATLFLRSADFDLVQFKYKDGKTLLELNYQLETKNLEYTENSKSELVSATELSFTVRSAGVADVEDKWVYNYIHNPMDSNMVIFDKRYYTLYAGQYDYEIVVTYSSKEKITRTGNFVIKDFTKKSEMVSDILLAHNIENFSEDKMHNSLFKKSNLYIVPNVSHTINGSYPYLKYYFEIYNLDTTNQTIIIEQQVLTGANEEISSFKKNKSVKSTNQSEFGLVPIDSLQNGVYKLVFNIYNEETLLATKTTKFYVLDPNKEFYKTDNFIESLSFERSPFSIMTAEKIEYEYETMKYILSEYEKSQFESLNSLRSKQRAMFAFWKDRDPDTTTAVNEFMTEYQKRLDFVNTYFSKGTVLPGWKSERGRILLRYGFPTNRELFRRKEGKNAAEEWQYDELFGGAYFFFVDRFGDNSFMLVHSTAPKEIKNFNWYNEFNPAIENDGSPKYNNSRMDSNSR